MVIGSLCHLVTQDRITPDMEKKSLILGWCVEWVSLHFHQLEHYCNYIKHDIAVIMTL